MTGERRRRAGWLFAVALLATIALALAFVDASGARSRDDALQSQPGFYAAFGFLASLALTLAARLVRIVLGRTNSVSEGSDVSDRA
jgi:hypothetical protein